MNKFLGIVLSMSIVSLQGFTTLQEAQQYAKTTQKGGLPKFDAKHFTTLLQDVVQARENIGYAGRYLVKLTPFPQTTFIVWGPLKGAFSSLVRTLTYLQQLGTITDDLKVANVATYLVFNGDVINSAETSLETLNLVLSLMKANPKNVFYMKGQAEDALQWQNDGLKKALHNKIPSTGETIPLGNTMAQFFETLPLALYITGQEPSDGLLRISFFSRTFDEIDETKCGNLLTSKVINAPQICYLTTPQKGPTQVKVLIKSEQRLMSYRHHPGLMLVEPDKGSVAWSIFSAPSPLYQSEYQFYQDAFAIIGTGKTIEEAVIALFNTDIRTAEPIQLRESFNLLTGMKAPYVPPTVSHDVTNQNVQQHLKALSKEIDALMSQVIELSHQLTAVKKQGAQT